MNNITVKGFGLNPFGKYKSNKTFSHSSEKLNKVIFQYVQRGKISNL